MRRRRKSRWYENLLLARECGFESRRPHHLSGCQAGQLPRASSRCAGARAGVLRPGTSGNEGLRTMRDATIGRLRRALSNFVDHFHGERNHQGKGNVLLFPRVKDQQRDGPVRCRDWVDSCATIIERRRDACWPISFLTIRGASLRRINEVGNPTLSAFGCEPESEPTKAHSGNPAFLSPSSNLVTS
jgi:hypothetical protein